MRFARTLALLVVAGMVPAVVPASAKVHHRYLTPNRDAYYVIRGCEPADLFSRLFGVRRYDCGGVTVPSGRAFEASGGIQITGISGI